jgi:hypothetical protein
MTTGDPYLQSGQGGAFVFLGLIDTGQPTQPVHESSFMFPEVGTSRRQRHWRDRWIQRRTRLLSQHAYPTVTRESGEIVLIDILVAILIVAVAAVLGLVVHPILWVIVLVAALWLFGRNRSRSHV